MPVALFWAVSAHAAPWSGIIDPSRAIDWSQSGVPGGIPYRTVQCASILASTYGNGSTDATAGIQAALNACPANEFVLLSPGKFLINSNLSVPSNVTLRGSGADQTILDTHGSGNGAVMLGSSVPKYPGVSVTNGATAGSQSISVSAATGIQAGSYLMISELNDPSYVSIQGGEGDCTWCDGGLGYNGTRVRGQIVEVQSVSGTNITIAPPLYSNYLLTPLAAPMTATKYAGVEDLQVYANNTGYNESILMQGCAYCWVRGVEDNYTDGDFIQLHFGFRDEVRDSYFSNAYRHAAGSTDSDIFVADKTSASKIENNIIERGHLSIMLNWGSAGNVIGYNYTLGEFDSSGTNFVTGGVGFHGAHPQFNLIEGNVMNRFEPDEIWGSSSHNTVFRNWTTGTARVCNPLTGRGTVICSGTNSWSSFQASRSMSIDHLSTSYNFVGNVTGSDAQNTLLAYGNPTTHVAILQYPSTRSYDSVNYNWTFGYGEASDVGSGTGCSGSTNPPCHSTNAFGTAFMHGNYTHADGNITWASGVTQVLPASFYLSGKPSWWGSLSFPAIGPDITGGTGPGGHTVSATGANPAQVCYMSVMGGQDGGPNSPLTFNAVACYGSPQSAPPTSTCDLNGDGVTNVSDVQLCVNQAIGVTACTSGDINKDGVCNVIDVQRDVNAALGGQCVTQ